MVEDPRCRVLALPVVEDPRCPILVLPVVEDPRCRVRCCPWSRSRAAASGAARGRGAALPRPVLHWIRSRIKKPCHNGQGFKLRGNP